MCFYSLYQFWKWIIILLNIFDKWSKYIQGLKKEESCKLIFRLRHLKVKNCKKRCNKEFQKRSTQLINKYATRLWPKDAIKVSDTDETKLSVKDAMKLFGKDAMRLSKKDATTLSHNLLFKKSWRKETSFRIRFHK